MPDTVLFIHSTAAGPFMWVPYQGTVPAGMQTLAPVNRGYAPHDLFTIDQAFTVEDEATHLLGQLPPGVTGLHLVAHSYGALAGLTLAKRAGVPVKSMWLYEPVLFGSLRREFDRLPADAAREVELLSGNEQSLLDPATAGTDAWIERFIDYWNGPGAWARMPDKIKAMARVVSAKMYTEVKMVSFDPGPFEHYAFDVPMTLVRGEATTAAARTMLDRLAQVNPHARVEVIPHAGHMGILTAAPQAAASLAAHWARVAASA